MASMTVSIRPEFKAYVENLSEVAVLKVISGELTEDQAMKEVIAEAEKSLPSYIECTPGS